MLTQGVHEYLGQDPKPFRKELEGCGYKVYTLASTIRDGHDFFDAVRAVLPLDPPVKQDIYWDALFDSLWEGLYQLSATKLAIIWPESGKMNVGEPEEFHVAKGYLSALVRSLADPKSTVGKVKEMVVVLV